jgi:hypothetical protein
MICSDEIRPAERLPVQEMLYNVIAQARIYSDGNHF